MVSGWDGTTSRKLSRVDVLKQLQHLLVTGVWRPGQVVQEQLLAEELKVSKTPVREALQLLALQGMVKPVSRVGYIVAGIDLADMAEVFRYRILLETDLVVERAALPGVLGVVRTAPADAVSPMEREAAFHRSLYHPLEPSRRSSSLSVLVDQTSRAMVYIGLSETLLTLLHHEHEQIEEAVVDRDVELARSLMVVHLSHLRDSVLAKLRQQLREQENLL